MLLMNKHDSGSSNNYAIGTPLVPRIIFVLDCNILSFEKYFR